MDWSDTGLRVRQLSHLWGGGGREELAISSYYVMLWLTFLRSSPFKIKYSDCVSFTSYGLEVLYFPR